MIGEIGTHLSTPNLHRLRRVSRMVQDIYSPKIARREQQQVMRGSPIRQRRTFRLGLEDVLVRSTRYEVLEFLYNELPAEALRGGGRLSAIELVRFITSHLTIIPYRVDHWQTDVERGQNVEHIIDYIRTITEILKTKMLPTVKAMFKTLRESKPEHIKEVGLQLIEEGNSHLRMAGNFLLGKAVECTAASVLHSYLCRAYKTFDCTNDGEPGRTSEFPDQESEEDESDEEDGFDEDEVDGDEVDGDEVDGDEVDGEDEEP